MFEKCIWGGLLLSLALTGRAAVADDPSADRTAEEVFNERIMPIFRSPDPSSCVQCHLASVDLKDYIRPSHEQTFASLRDQGLIDLEEPSKSKILHLIAMGDQDLDRGARLIHARMRIAEHEAFAAWIKACCQDPALRSLPAASATNLAKPEKPEAVIRHARKDRLLDSFERNVWSQRMRCYPCHTPGELQDGPVPSEKATERHREYVKQYGQRMNIFRETPAATMKHLIVSSRQRSEKHLPLINVDQPTESLLVLKPTAKLPAKTEDGTLGQPSSVMPVSHGGGLKMHVNDQSYKSFLAWIEDYANVVQGEYDAAEDLPADNWFPSQNVLRVKETPDAWEAMNTAQLFVYGWDKDREAWQATPLAFTQGMVTPRGLVNGSLFLLKPAASEGEKDDTGPPALEPGRYLIKAFIDRDGRLEDEPTVLLHGETSDGEAVIEAKWQEGFKNAEVVEGARFE